MNEAFWEACRQVFEWRVLGIILASCAYGLFVGAIPGLTATMAVALMIPLTFFLDPIAALGAIVALEACAIFAGDIPSALVRIPGTPSSAAYVDDSYLLVQRGRANEVFGISLVWSVVGGLVGAAVLILAAPLVLDLVLFLDLAARAGMSGVQEWLSFYFKSPVTAEGRPAEHDIFVQLMKLKNALRHMRGEPIVTDLGLEYYD